MAEDGEDGEELPCVDHDPLNEGAVGKRKKKGRETNNKYGFIEHNSQQQHTHFPRNQNLH